MNKWANAEDLKQALEKKWQKQSLLKDWLADDLAFPLDIAIKRPVGRELLDNYVQVAAWIKQWQTALQGMPLELVYESITSRHVNTQQIPRYLRIHQASELWQWLGRSVEAEALEAIYTRLTNQWPRLDKLIQKMPLKFLKIASQENKLIAVLSWFEAHPHSRRYLRQLDMPGVDTKFIENNKSIIDVCLQAILPKQQFDAAIISMRKNGFERKYGLSYDPPMIRFRILDAKHYIGGLSDLNVPLSEFARLHVSLQNIFITENKINGLAFPAFDNAMVIFGLGYGVELLAEVRWLEDKRIWYWGDIDTHGFNILSQVRKHLPQTRSMLMDQTSLLACRSLWVEEAKPMSRFDTSNLEGFENEVLEGLWQQRWQANSLRLEQEVIPFHLLENALIQITGAVLDNSHAPV